MMPRIEQRGAGGEAGGGDEVSAAGASAAAPPTPRTRSTTSARCPSGWRPTTRTRWPSPRSSARWPSSTSTTCSPCRGWTWRSSAPRTCRYRWACRARPATQLVVEAIERVIASARRHNVVAGIHMGSVERAAGLDGARACADHVQLGPGLPHGGRAPAGAGAVARRLGGSRAEHYRRAERSLPPAGWRHPLRRLYRPAEDGRYPALVTRTPYDKSTYLNGITPLLNPLRRRSRPATWSSSRTPGAARLRGAVRLLQPDASRGAQTATTPSSGPPPCPTATARWGCSASPTWGPPSG